MYIIRDRRIKVYNIRFWRLIIDDFKRLQCTNNLRFTNNECRI